MDTKVSLQHVPCGLLGSEVEGLFHASADLTEFLNSLLRTDIPSDLLTAELCMARTLALGRGERNTCSSQLTSSQEPSTAGDGQVGSVLGALNS